MLQKDCLKTEKPNIESNDIFSDKMLQNQNQQKEYSDFQNRNPNQQFVESKIQSQTLIDEIKRNEQIINQLIEKNNSAISFLIANNPYKFASKEMKESKLDEVKKTGFDTFAKYEESIETDIAIWR